MMDGDAWRPVLNRTQAATVIRWLTILSMGVAAGMLALGAVVLIDARTDAWRQAEQASANLGFALERDVARNISVYDLSLQGAVDALQQPGIDQVSPEIRHTAIFDRAASAEYLGSLLVLDEAGNIIADSTSTVPHRLNLSDRDYFRVHQDKLDAGLYVSRPFRSRLRNQDPSIAISRRISGPGGKFAGVVMGALRLAYFQELFERLNVGVNGSVTLSRTDGRVIARHPFRDADIDRDVSGSEAFQRIITERSGQFTGRSGIDGIERLFTFRRVGALPLVLTVAVSVNEIYAAWWRKALIIGPVLAILCGTTMTLCLLFRREMLRRMEAERALIDTAEELSVLAATDQLTGLANRRTFEIEFNREWRRAIRHETSIAMLILDADCFKLYNDRYGHQDGDQVLRSISTCISQAIRRPGDVGARYGGEEFVAIMPETEIAGALAIAERIHSAVANLKIPHAGSPNGQVTVSIGVATTRPVLGEAEGLLLKMADVALYEAKNAGRNRISVSGCNRPLVLAWTPTPL